MTTITTNHGTFSGKTAQSIARREYGRDAKLRASSDRNAPQSGMIVRTDKHGTHVLATLVTVDGIIERDEYEFWL